MVVENIAPVGLTQTLERSRPGYAHLDFDFDQLRRDFRDLGRYTRVPGTLN